MDKQKLYSEIVEYLTGKGVCKSAIFGSYARNEEKPESDIDIMVDFDTISIGLIEFVRIERELSEKIGIKVDLVMNDSVNPIVRKYVENDLVVLK